MTLEDFLKLPIAAGFHILNHITGIADIPVEHVNILEPPVENFVRSNEIVMSTALSVREQPDELYQFIYEVYQAGAAAIVFALPNDDFSLLEPLLPQFTQYHFPILSMPWSCLFSEVVEEAMKEIWKKDEETQSYLESMQHELLNYFLNGKTLDDAAELLFKYLASDILIFDANDILKGRNRNMRRTIQTGEYKHILNDDILSRFSRIEITSGGHLYGYVLLETVTLSVTLYSGSAKRCLNTPLTLWFDREWSMTSAKMKSKEDYVWKLAHHEFDSPQDAISKAFLLQFQTDTKYACFVADVSMHLLSGSKQNASGTTSIFQSSNTIVEEQVIQTAHDLGLSVMTSLHKQRLIIFLEAPDAPLASEAAENYLNLFEKNVRNYVPSIDFIWGYDNQSRSIDAVYISYTNAKAALKLCQTSDGLIKRSCFQLSILPKILSLLCTNPEIASMAGSILRDLTEYDKKKGTNYLDTLKAYIECNCNVSETARVMHLHRQSLLYRIDKIEELVHMPLKKHETLLVLELAIMILSNGKNY